MLHYVGRTGDTSSPNAQSPFSRLSQHLSANGKSNALRRHLKEACIGETETCKHVRLFPYGPIFPAGEGHQEHNKARDVVAALEKALADAMADAGYLVLNRVSCRKDLDDEWFEKVRGAFSAPSPSW